MREGCALVTGASRGIGAAVAKELAREGWAVGVNYRNDEDGATAVAAEIEEGGGRACTVQGDVRDPASTEAMFAALEERFGRILVVVNNAGARADGLAPQLSDEDWDVVVDTNLSSAFRTTRRALPAMLRARFGRIVNVASVVGIRANAGQANYAASKAGLVGLTKTVAAEVARRGVTVNAVAPGLIDTEFIADGNVGDGILKHLPARRLGSPAEVAACVRFLASEDAAYVTGSVLTVDGGLTA